MDGEVLWEGGVGAGELLGLIGDVGVRGGVGVWWLGFGARGGESDGGFGGVCASGKRKW